MALEKDRGIWLDAKIEHLATQGRFMDKITSGLLSEFSKEFGINELPEDKRFESFSTYLTVRRHYSEAFFDPTDLVIGNGNDTGFDALAIIVNNNLVSDIDTVRELAEINNYVEATFVFVQSERSSGFSTSKIGQFGFGVCDFFGEGKLVRNDDVKENSEIMNEIFRLSGKFKKGNPSCYLYYVTTGKWLGDNDLEVRAEAVVGDLRSTGNFSTVKFIPIGADQIQDLYNQTKNAIRREFLFPDRTILPDIANVQEAHIGVMAAQDFLKLITDEKGDIVKSLFYEQVRDWKGYNEINSEIRQTIKSENRDRFALMNNGITIVAKSLKTTGHKFAMENFQIVNGCQTSHVLHDNSDLLTAAVRIPVRIICTADEAVTEAIITATNSQTEIPTGQFFALRPFSKKLEQYFKTFDVEKRLYYERRSNQYDGLDYKSKIIVHDKLVRAVGAMFLGEPHRTTKNYRALEEQIGNTFFRQEDCMEPYYAAAFAAYKLEPLFKNKLPSKYKAGRYQILLAARLLIDNAPLSLGSKKTSKRCEEIIARLWQESEEILVRASQAIDEIVKKHWDRDFIRTQSITDNIFSHFGVKKGSGLTNEG